jgi:hypothetical protein
MAYRQTAKISRAKRTGQCQMSIQKQAKGVVSLRTAPNTNDAVHFVYRILPSLK